MTRFEPLRQAELMKAANYILAPQKCRWQVEEILEYELVESHFDGLAQLMFENSRTQTNHDAIGTNTIFTLAIFCSCQLNSFQNQMLPNSYSILVLTYNRNHLLSRLVEELMHFAEAGVQIIVVDNCSERPATEVTGRFPWITNIRAPRNLGAAGRNLGFTATTGDVVICLDDDIAELCADAMERLDRAFSDPLVAAVNFKVLDQATRQVVNWVHHREIEKYSDQSFQTYEITEGAVAFRRSAIETSGGYPESFFLSHEGPDLAFRLMNNGLRVIYSPDISVVHSFAEEGRHSWRNYYYDTRNTLWLAIRNLPLIYGVKVVLRQSISMFVYAVRDGYARWWFKGMYDGVKGIADARKGRRCLSRVAFEQVKAIDKARPSLLYFIRKRLLRRDLRF